MAEGIGVGLRSEIRDEVEESILNHVDFIECNMFRSEEGMKEFVSPYVGKIPILIHSIDLSLVSVQPPLFNKIQKLKNTVKYIQPSWVSEHLSFSRSSEIEIDSFIPLQYTEEAVEVVSKHIKMLKSKIGVPVAMENITHDFSWPESDYAEVEFISRVVEKADCGLLLDITNLYINAHNLSYDPYTFLDSLPKERIMQLHVAGNSQDNGKLVDSHVGGIHPEVLGYMEWIFRNTSCRAALIERDSQLDCFEDLLQDIKVCKEVYNKYANKIVEVG